MAIIRKESKFNVVEMAERRVKNIFDNGLKVYLGFSGGKDSLAIAQVVYSLIQRGEINPKQLTVNFIDEEAIFPCVERTVKQWRKKFMLVGAKFNWYCLEIKHFNTLNRLTSDESFICWDRYKKDVWVRPMPDYAIKYHPLFKPRQETYQSFLERIESDGITITGVRVAESVQRLINFSTSKRKDKLQPIYDWKDADVWKYLLEQKVDIPESYLYLYQVGKTKRELRLSHFFSIDTVGNLVSMNEFYPDLMKRILRREPNAYLVSLYWDSEMFRRSSNRRKQIEQKEQQKDYKAEVKKLLSDINKNFETVHQREVARAYRNLVIKSNLMIQQKHYKRIYEALISGDPKKRTLRAVMADVFSDARKEV